MKPVKFKNLVVAIICSIAAFKSGSASASTDSVPTAESLLAGWKNSIYTNHEHSKISLSLIEPGASPIVRLAEIWYRGKAGGESRIFMRFGSPASIRGVAFLSLQNAGDAKENISADQWLYLPAFKKSRRLSSHSRDESFLDSDFSNGDISFQYEGAFDFKMAGEKVLQNHPVYVLEGKVKAARRDGLAYSREVLYFTKAEKLNLRAEFYDQKNKLVKVLNVSNWKKYGSRWAANRIEIETTATQHKSVLEFSARETNTVPADRLFTIGELESGI